MTHICVPIVAATCGGMVREIDAAQAAGADMIELRLDYLQVWDDASMAALKERAARFNGQVIATCRPVNEGGRFSGSETERMELLRAVLGEAIDYLDIEYESWRRSPIVGERVNFECAGSCECRNPRLRLILSRHDFAHTPADLDAVFAELLTGHADVVKVACKPDSIVDSLRMLEALRKAREHPHLARRGQAPFAPDSGGPSSLPPDAAEQASPPPDAGQRTSPPLSKGGAGGIIALSMGETGILTRVLARKFGALLTFAKLDKGKESAPGQPTIHELREVYRWDAIHPATKVYGVIGCPVAHSMSPAIHNAAFGAIGHDGVYLPLRVEPSYEAFAAFLDACLARPWLDLRGLSVTIPHKENLLRYVEARGGQVDPLTRRIGVANTLVIEPCGTGILPVEVTGQTSVPHRLYAFNTDYRGALDALCEGLGCEPKDLAGLPVAVLGAGGVSRAIVAGLTDCGCDVTIYNRTAQKATALAAEFGADALPFDMRVRSGTKVIINCTSIGMWPHISDTPRGGAGILPEEKDLTVFDTVYNPIETRLLREAREQGHKTIDGVAMFVKQAAAQFERWTGQAAPTALMREIVVRRLSQT